jgi:hypothetical protein
MRTIELKKGFGSVLFRTINVLKLLYPTVQPNLHPPWRKRKKIAKFLMRTFTYRSTFLYG